MATTTPPPAASPRLPWYCFLYRLLGAQGTFWLWIVSVVALWWTASPAFHRLANRTPTTGRSPASLGNIGLRDTTRWVKTTGVLVRLDRTLLIVDAERAPALPPVPLLFDGADAAATWWTETRAIADRLAATPESDEAEHARAFQRLQVRWAELKAEPATYGPAPGSCLLVQEPNPQPLSPPAPVHVDGQGALGKLIEDIKRWGALVRERVEPALEVKGVLVETPHVYVERFKAELGAEVAPMMLQRDRELGDGESYVFAGAAITLLFLAAGFRGATRTRVDDRPPSPSPGTAAT